ncbi:LTA synthase family protein [Algibacter agarivorans]|uniref:LTA synthase family protein n=1 Tax=Algibacter agarivorans TaxID=1109741 RepID=A0ABP9GLP1_9FLAO
MKINKTIPFLLKVYLLVLSIFSVFRVILFLTELNRIDFNEVDILTIVQSFIMGIRFDIVISGYILIFPALILLISELFLIKSKIIEQFFFFWIFILFTIAFTISAADIPYFNQFYDRFSIGAFEWIENLDFVVSMVVQEPKYFIISIPFLVLDILFFILLKKLFSQKSEPVRLHIFFNTLTSLMFLAIMFVGIRGRLQKKSTIKVGTAYFSDNSFLNKLGLNPVFTLMRSYIESTRKENDKIHLMDKTIAINKVQSYLNIDKKHYKSPVARKIQSDTILTSKPNVVIILMESMSAAKMKRHGNKQELTPFLDSLSYNSIYFENVYSAGKHTFNGVFSTLFSFPALYRQHTMRNIRKYDGISSTLLKNGYSTTYITTHDSQFDNIEGFLRANDFQNIVSQADYPLSEIKTAMGVPDDYMFRHSIPIINDLYKKENSFFVTFLTGSDHGPFYVPEYFHPKTKDIKTQIIEYADWSLRKFIDLASKETWFDNTIFVFLADHGVPLHANYDIALNYFHVPLVFYAPSIFKSSKTYKKTGSQIDVYPTIMGLLKQEYVNNTLGIDLIKQERAYAIINDDDKIGIIDSTYFCIMKEQGNTPQLYKYRDIDKTNYFEQNKRKAFEMVDYAKSNMQIHQNMILSKEITLHKDLHVK